MCRSSAAVVPMSRRSGTLRKVCSPSASNAEHKIGSAAFFEPLMATVPESGVPPMMWMLSITARAGPGKKQPCVAHPARPSNRTRARRNLSCHGHAEHEKRKADGDHRAPADGLRLHEAVFGVDR